MIYAVRKLSREELVDRRQEWLEKELEERLKKIKDLLLSIAMDADMFLDKHTQEIIILSLKSGDTIEAIDEFQKLFLKTAEDQIRSELLNSSEWLEQGDFNEYDS